MLGKIVRYDMGATGRILFPVYAALIAAALLFGLSLGTLGDSGEGIMQLLTGFLYVGLIGATVIITIVMIISRFYRSMMGEEGYLTHVLPVPTGTLIAGKTISASLWVLFGLIAGILSAIVLGIGAVVTALIFHPGGNLEISGFGDLAGFLGQNFKAIYILIFIEIILAILASSAAGIGRVYTAISVGHLWTNHRIAGAVLVYIGIGIVLETVVTSAMMGIYKLPFGFMEDFLENGPSDPTTLALVLLSAIISTAVLAVIYSLISWVGLKKHLNLQ